MMSNAIIGQLGREHRQKVRVEYQGNISATAKALRMHRRTRQRKLAKRPAKAGVTPS
jgi:two-component system response regulator RegA